MKKGSYILPMLLLAAFFSMPLDAQLNNTLYFMSGIHQSNRLNPAFQPKEDFYIGIPVLSSVRIEGRSSSLAYKDVIYQHPDEPDSLITFLHPRGSKQAFLDEVKGLNALNSGIANSILSFGFRTGAGYFSVDLSTRWEGNLYYPGDLFRLLLEGTDRGESYSMDGTGLELSAFQEVSLGWSYDLGDKLRIGARAKMYLGMADLRTINSELQLDVAENSDWRLTSDMQFAASLPFADVNYEDGEISDIEMKENLDNPDFMTIRSYVYNFKNLGFGLDLGLDYRPIENLRLSVSLTDLGYINWKDEVHHIDYSTSSAGSGGTYVFQGFELNPFELDDDFTFDDFVDSSLTQMSDSLSGFLAFSEGGSYSRMLNAKLYAGATYTVIPGISLGLLSRTDFLKGKVLEQVTASANFAVGRILNFSLSYSYMNAYFKNIGAGLSLNFGPVNMYLASDNALNMLFWPGEARSNTLWFGLSLAFGYKDKTDHPLVH